MPSANHQKHLDLVDRVFRPRIEYSNRKFRIETGKEFLICDLWQFCSSNSSNSFLTESAAGSNQFNSIKLLQLIWGPSGTQWTFGFNWVLFRLKVFSATVIIEWALSKRLLCMKFEWRAPLKRFSMEGLFPFETCSPACWLGASYRHQVITGHSNTTVLLWYMYHSHWTIAITIVILRVLLRSQSERCK